MVLESGGGSGPILILNVLDPEILLESFSVSGSCYILGNMTIRFVEKGAKKFSCSRAAVSRKKIPLHQNEPLRLGFRSFALKLMDHDSIKVFVFRYNWSSKNWKIEMGKDSFMILSGELY